MAAAPTRRRRAQARSSPLADLRFLLPALAAGALWTLGLWSQSPRAMAALGLVSLFNAAMVAALLLLVAGFVYAWWRRLPGWVIGAHLAVFTLLVHGTPAVFYETLHRAWAWKHLGIVDFIVRTSSVDPSIEATPIYHAWPGFFASSALLAELLGYPDAVMIAVYAPVIFAIVNLLGLRYLLRALTGDTPTIWLAMWIFAIGNWIGQEYFSPQAFAFPLYLVILGLVLRAMRHSPALDGGAANTVPSRAALPIAILMSAAVASSHQITPGVLVVSLTALVLVRATRGWWLPVVVAVVVVGWAGTVGQGVLRFYAQGLVEELFNPVAAVEANLGKASSSLPEQLLVTWAGRLGAVTVVLLAMVGAARLHRRHRLDRALIALVVAPAAVPLATSFGGEALFRAYLFALPGLALLAASAVTAGTRASTAASLPRSPPAHEGRSRLEKSAAFQAAVVATVSVALVTGFSFATFGKDHVYSFTDEEVAAARWVMENGSPGTLLIVGNSNYPQRFRNYENFIYLQIEDEPEETWDAFASDPTEKLSSWMSGSRSLFLLTRSQEIQNDTFGPLEPGSIERIEAAIRDSSDFRVVFQNQDAVVFEYAPARLGSE